MRTTRHQFEILVDYMERNGDISKLRLNHVGKARMSRHWDELSLLLNNTRTGNGVAPIRTADQWRKVWSDFKMNVRRKVLKAKQLATDNDYFSNSIEARTMAIMNNEPADLNSEAGDTDDTDVKCVVDVRKALNLLSESDEEDLVISDDDKEKEVKVDFSIQNFIEKSCNSPDDEDVKCVEPIEKPLNVNLQKPKAKRGRKKKVKEPTTSHDRENDNCSLISKSMIHKPNFSVPSTNVIDEPTNISKNTPKKSTYDQGTDNIFFASNNVNNLNATCTRDKAVKQDTSDVIDLVLKSEETEDNNDYLNHIKNKTQNNDFNDCRETDEPSASCSIPTSSKIQDSRTGTQKNSVSDNAPKVSSLQGSLRQLLLERLRRKKMADQSQSFDSENVTNFNKIAGIPNNNEPDSQLQNFDSENIAKFNKIVGIPHERESVISAVPNSNDNFIDNNTVANETPINHKRPSVEPRPKPVQKRRRKVYSVLMDNEREERQFEREITRMKLEIMREEIQLKNRGLFMFQKFLHLAEQFFVNTSVLK